jgi:hypothetical protein
MIVYFQCDLKVLSDAKGGAYYRDHLPLLGMLTFTDSPIISIDIGPIFVLSVDNRNHRIIYISDCLKPIVEKIRILKIICIAC